MNHTISRWLACGACAVGSVAFAQEPAARLLPARAVDPAEPTVVRGAPPAPGFQFQPPVSTPAPGVHRPPPQPALPPAPAQAQPAQKQPPQPPGQASLWGGVKSAFGGKPAEPQSQPQPPWWPTGEQQPPTPPPQPPQGVYAGPPAYRWYGYGTPTAGANPYAPTGRYPQASGTWFSQTGATPGAFPVPVGGMPVTPREQPVVVQAFPQEQTRPVDVPRPTWSRPSEWPEVMPQRAVVVAETPRPVEPREVRMPAGPGMPADLSAPTVPPTPEVEWLPASANSRVPIASTPPADPTPKTLPVPTAPPGTTPPPSDWAPAKRPADAPLPAVPSLPTVTVTRGQAPPAARTDADVDATIRSACFGRASRVGVARPGPQRLHVTLVVPTEGDARDAAAVVSRLPELKAYAVTFEAVIGK